MKDINNRNRQTTAASIPTFDFSFLYTILPHNNLFKLLCELIDFDFEANNGIFLTVNKCSTTWTTKDKEYPIAFSKAALKQCVHFM